jgi:hypothetical protein
VAGLWVPVIRSWVLGCDLAEGGADADDRWMALRLLDLLFRHVVSTATVLVSWQSSSAEQVGTR